jgi:hypothetical protein
MPATHAPAGLHRNCGKECGNRCEKPRKPPKLRGFSILHTFLGEDCKVLLNQTFALTRIRDSVRATHSSSKRPEPDHESGRSEEYEDPRDIGEGGHEDG